MSMQKVEVVVASFALVVALALAARRISTPLPVVLALAGLGLGALSRVVPAIPVELVSPGQVLPLFLPPLLLAASYRVPLGAFRASLRPITLLAVGLVLASMGACAAVVHALIPGIPWAAAFVLGAVVAPPDPVAATQVGSKLGLNTRLVTILEGEGLVNDATALAAYQIAVSAAVTGRFSLGHAVVEVVVTACVGVAVGLAVAWCTTALQRRVDEAVLETAVSLLAPYAAYLLAERVHGSAVLAVVTLGFVLRLKVGEVAAPATRLTSRAVWNAAEFAAMGMVFVLVGLQIGRIATAELPAGVITAAVLVTLTAVLVRIAWMFAVPALVRLFAGRAAADYQPRELAVLGWAGMRGVVSLALALVIPVRTANGDPFPARTALVVIALAVVFATLVGQGLTLAPLIRRLRVGQAAAARRHETAARRLALRAARACLGRLEATGTIRPDARTRMMEELSHEMGVGRDQGAGSTRDSARVRAIRDALRAQREVVLRLRDDGRLEEGTASRLEAELDVDEMALCGSSAEMMGKER